MHRSLCLAVLLLVGAFALNDHSRTVRLKAGHIDTTAVPSLETLEDSNTNHLLTESHSNVWKTAMPAASGYMVHVDRAAFNKREVEAALGGVKLSEYLPHNTFLVYAPHALVKSLPQTTKGVLWTAHYGSQNKMDPNSRKLLTNPTSFISASEVPKSVSLVVSTFASLDESALRAAVERQFALTGLELHVEAIPDSTRVEVTVSLSSSTDAVAMHATASEIMEFVADHAEVKWVEVRKKIETKNKYARYITQLDQSDTSGDSFTTPLYAGGIDGEGVIIGVGDTGVDTFHCSFRDEDVDTPFDDTDLNHRKIVHYWTYVDDTDYAGGHGSHVSGSVLGHVDDVSEDAYYHSGMAPNAKLWFTDIGDEYGGLDVPASLTSYFRQPQKDNVHIHSNSWGCSAPYYYAPDFCNTYDSECQDIDEFTYEHPDFLVLIAAGNDGDSTRYGSVGSPGVAKNGLTVGASSNSWEAWSEYGTEYFDPNDLEALLNEDIMAYFSSTGPTFDGRIKPDIVAPGHEIMSVNASGSDDETCGVHTMSGTSMATPVTAGSVGLMQQYFQDGFYPTGASIKDNAFYPSAALLKAAVINGATPIAGQARLFMDPLYLPILDEDQVEREDLAVDGSFSVLVAGETVSLYLTSAIQRYKFTPGSGAYIKIWMSVPGGDIDMYAALDTDFDDMLDMSITYSDEHIIIESPGVGVPVYIALLPYADESYGNLLVEMSANDDYPSIPTLTCADTFADTTRASIVRCPTNCVTSDGVVGERWYTVDSSVCAAAKHQGVITSMEPFDATYQYARVTFYGYFEVDLEGSTRFGITSTAGTASPYVMTFNVAGGEVNEVEYGGFDDVVPNPSSGFGRVNLLNTIKLETQTDRKVVILTNRADDSVADGASMSYTIDNDAITGELKFTLVWSDPPAALATDFALVNNLDLMVTTSDCTDSGNDGVDWYGNGGTSSDMDMVNNVEQVVILTPQDCTYTVMVMATDVPSGPQTFALVAGGRDFEQTGTKDEFATSGEDVTGWGGPPVDHSGAADARPIVTVVALLAAAVAALL